MRTYPDQVWCAFCHLTDTNVNEITEAVGTMRVVPNKFPYEVWDGSPVVDHQMVVPARHVLSLDEYTDREALDFFAVVRRYEAMGYSVYSRSPRNTGRSIKHVHTHLILTGQVHAAPSVSVPEPVAAAA